MHAILRAFVWAAVCILALCHNVVAATVTVPISCPTGWTLSNATSGCTMVQGGPAIYTGTFTAAIPAGATNISFTLNSFSVDDKGVVQLNGTTIGDAVIATSNGAAGGAGTFDFGLGGGNQAYSFVGFVPGTAFPIANGTLQMTLVVFMNDTNSTDPSAPPLAVTNISGFGLSGTLTYDTALAASSTALISSTNPSTVGSSVTFTATVTGAAPTGTVEFFDGMTSLGTVALNGGVAALATSSLTQGTHLIGAVYSGDANNAASSSSPLTQLVNAAVVFAPPVAVPTLSSALLALLCVLLAGLAAAVRMQRKK